MNFKLWDIKIYEFQHNFHYLFTFFLAFHGKLDKIIGFPNIKPNKRIWEREMEAHWTSLWPVHGFHRYNGPIQPNFMNNFPSGYRLMPPPNGPNPWSYYWTGGTMLQSNLVPRRNIFRLYLKEMIKCLMIF